MELLARGHRCVHPGRSARKGPGTVGICRLARGRPGRRGRPVLLPPGRESFCLPPVSYATFRSPPARRLPERPWKGPGSTEMRPAERSCARWEVKGNWRPSTRRRRPLGRPTVPRHLHPTLRAHARSPRAEPGRGDPLSGLLRPIGAEGEACRPRSRAGGWRAVQARRVPGPRAPRPGSCRRRARRVQTIHDFINVEHAILFMLAAHRK